MGSLAAVAHNRIRIYSGAVHYCPYKGNNELHSIVI